MDQDILHDLMMDGYGVMLSPMLDGDGDWMQIIAGRILGMEDGVMTPEFTFSCDLTDLDSVISKWMEDR